MQRGDERGDFLSVTVIHHRTTPHHRMYTKPHHTTVCTPYHTTPPYVHHTTPHHITSHGTTPHHTTTVCTPNHTTSHHIEPHHTTPPPYVHQTTLHHGRTYTHTYVTMVRLGKANHCSHECAFDGPSGRGSELNIVLVSYSGLSKYWLNLIYTGGLQCGYFD